jgi:hypothetical protein
VENSASASAPAGSASFIPPSPALARTPSPENESKSKDVSAEGNKQEVEDSSFPKDKFFIVKSLTVEDLELSVRNGIWATQSHNEETLNKAYQVRYLVSKYFQTSTDFTSRPLKRST